MNVFCSCNLQEQKTKSLLEKGKEAELGELYDELLNHYIQDNENYEFDEDSNCFYLKSDAVIYILKSLLIFHMKNHVPLLTEENSKNWDDWFYFYKKYKYGDGSESAADNYVYEDFADKITMCEFCKLAYDEDSDIAWPGDISIDIIEDFPETIKPIVRKIEDMNSEKWQKDAELAEAELRRKQEEEERKSRFNGVWGCEFGMSKQQVRKIMQQKTSEQPGESTTIEVYGKYGYTTSLTYSKNPGTYGGIPVDTIFFFFLHDELYHIEMYIYSGTGGTSVSSIRDVVNAVVKKYKFSKTTKELDFKSYYYGKDYHKYDKGNIRLEYEDGYTQALDFYDTNIFKSAFPKAKAMEDAYNDDKLNSIGNRNDF